MFYGKNEIKFFLRCKDGKAYQVIRELAEGLVKKGYARPPHGKIQKKIFCEKFLLNMEECDKAYQQYQRSIVCVNKGATDNVVSLKGDMVI